MQDQVDSTQRVPWNKGKLTGAKPPLRSKHVWTIRTKLQIESRTRDLAMFNLAIDSKLRGCDVVALRVEDVAAGGYTADRATVRQKKTGRPVRFELSDQTRQAVDDYLRVAGKRPGEFLFTGRRGPDRSMTTRQYARLVSQWIGSAGLALAGFGACTAVFSRLEMVANWRPFLLGGAGLVLLTAWAMFFRGRSTVCRTGSTCAVATPSRSTAVLLGLGSAFLALALVWEPFVEPILLKLVR